MNAANPFSKDGETAEPGQSEPSLAEILASIRRLIADDQALSASLNEARKETPRPGASAEDLDAGVRAGGRFGSQRQLLSGGAETAAMAAFQTLLASRFARHSDVVVDMTREMLRPMLKAWLDAHLPAIVERLVSAEIERVARSE